MASSSINIARRLEPKGYCLGRIEVTRFFRQLAPRDTETAASSAACPIVSRLYLELAAAPRRLHRGVRTAGDRRDDSDGRMEIVSGDFGCEKTHHVVPQADRVDAGMSAFLKWFDGSHDLDSLVKAGIAHLWFGAIHPFGNGSGYITRTAADRTLARLEARRHFSMSAAIERSRMGYYEAL